MAKRILEFSLTQLDCDPAQYKPYSPSFSPKDHIIVQVEIPNEEVVDEIIEERAYLDGEKYKYKEVTITLDGLTAICREIADKLDDMDTHRREDRALKLMQPKRRQ